MPGPDDLFRDAIMQLLRQQSGAAVTSQEMDQMQMQPPTPPSPADALRRLSGAAVTPQEMDRFTRPLGREQSGAAITPREWGAMPPRSAPPVRDLGGYGRQQSGAALTTDELLRLFQSLR